MYALGVLAAMSLSFWPDASGVSGLVAMLLSLPWGLGVILLLDTVDRAMVASLGPPLVAICGFLNAYLLYNALRGRPA